MLLLSGKSLYMLDVYTFTCTCTHSLCRFGGYLISVEILLAGDMLAVFYAILVGSLSLGQANPSIESLVTATGAAAEIFEVIDRVRVCCIDFVMLILFLSSLHRSLLFLQILMKGSSLMISSHPLHFKMLCLDIQPDLMYQY